MAAILSSLAHRTLHGGYPFLVETSMTECQIMPQLDQSISAESMHYELSIGVTVDRICGGC